MLTEVFDKLKSLQVVLSKKCQVEEEVNEIPKVLTTKIELLNRIKKTSTDKQKNLEDVMTRARDLTVKMAEAERERETYEKQMDQIKTQREYEALDKQIKDMVAKESEYRKEIQKMESLRDDLKTQVDKEKVLIHKQEEEVKDEQAKIKHDVKEKQKVLKTLEKEEMKIIPGLDEDILFKFERIIKSKAGVGIVPIRNGICTGCHMILPSQFVNDVRSGTGIRFCPECSRILFCPSEAESEETYIYDEDMVVEEEDEADEDDGDDSAEDDGGGGEEDSREGGED
jgi:predicted  nucleic acid-binding Zn-ribbon protein